ncbi:hypothetical protein PEC18_22575 [Paucibacter sp. O1-1]|nr:hypothetical protein [Paucibacter sp. O1-1]MDA3828529.1 hypothetical protein [Paucibacter sp. O1-1]
MSEIQSGHHPQSFPLVVTVSRKPELRREFRYNRLDGAEQCMRELVAGTHTAGKPVQSNIEQGNHAWEVRFRDRRPSSEQDAPTKRGRAARLQALNRGSFTT